MKKRIISFISVLIILASVIVPAFAEGKNYIIDNYGILSAEEFKTLSERAESVSVTYGIDTVVYFTDTFGSLDPGEYCDRIWHQYNFSDDCVMMAIALDERAYYYYGCGLGSVVQTDFGSEYIDSKVLPSLKQSNYYKAASEYLTFSAEFANHYYQTGSAYDVNDRPNELKMLLLKFLGSTGIGLLLAGVPLRKQKKSMNTVVSKRNASDYIRSGGIRLSQKNDIFINRHVSAIPIPKVESSSFGSSSHGGTTMHTSSSGHSYSGHGGHF